LSSYMMVNLLPALPRRRMRRNRFPKDFEISHPA
jgi:hypothetical protein